MLRLVIRAVIVAAVCLPAAGEATAQAANTPAHLSGFVYQQKVLPPFAQSKRYLLSGVNTAYGCQYAYPDMHVPAGATRWASRDLAMDSESCTKLEEEGVPPIDDASETPGSLAPLQTTTSQPSPSGNSISPLAVSSHSGYEHVWWEDILGIRLTQDWTYISWTTNGSCAQSGSSSVGLSWDSGTGWEMTSYGGTQWLLCSAYHGQSYSHFANAAFCPLPPVVYIDYVYVNAWGNPNGKVGGNFSTTSSFSCAPLWQHSELIQTS
jgi:hypothetical protein